MKPFLVLLPFIMLQAEIFVLWKGLDCFLRPKPAICTKLLNKMGLNGADTLLGSCSSASTTYPMTVDQGAPLGHFKERCFPEHQLHKLCNLFYTFLASFSSSDLGLCLDSTSFTVQASFPLMQARLRSMGSWFAGVATGARVG